MPTSRQQPFTNKPQRSTPCWLWLLLCALLGLAPSQSTADGLFGLVGVPSVDIEGYGWLGDLYLEHTLKVLSTSEEQPEPEINAVFIEDSLWIISGQLQQQGYLYPTIKVRISDTEGELLYEGAWAGQELTPPLPPAIEGAHVQFTIEAGIRFYFESITIEGLPEDFTAQPASFFYPTDQLLSFKNTRFYNKSRGISGLQGLTARLRLMGYRDAEVTDQSAEIDRTTGAVHFFAKIHPGPVYYAQELLIEPGSLELASQVLQGIPLLDNPAVKPRLTPQWLQARTLEVRNRYYKHGYPEVRITIRYEDASAPRSTEVLISNAVDNEEVPPPAPPAPTPEAPVPTPEVNAAVSALKTTAATSANDAHAVTAGNTTTTAAADNTTTTAAADNTATTAATDSVTSSTATTTTTDSATNGTTEAASTATATTTTPTASTTTASPTITTQTNATTAPLTPAATEAPAPPASALEAATAPVAANAAAGFDPAATLAAVVAAEAKAPDSSSLGHLQPVSAASKESTQAAEAIRHERDAGNGNKQQTTSDTHQQTTSDTRQQAASDASPQEANTTSAATAGISQFPPPAVMHTPYTEPVTTADDSTILAPRIPPEPLDGEPHSRYQRVIIQVQSGPQVKIGTIGFSGEYGTNMSVLNSQLAIAPGQQLDRNRVEDTRNKLNALGIFQSVEIEYTEVDDNTWDVTYNMQMKQRTEISLIMGVGTFDIIRGGFLIEQNNLWGLAHNQRLRAVQSFKATDVTYRYGIPQVFGNDVDFYAKGSYLYRQEISFNRQEYGAATGFQHYYRPLRTTLDIQYSLEQLSARNRDFTTAPGPTEVTVSSIALKASHNGVDNPIFPTKGWQARASAEFALRDLGGQVDYQRLEMAVAWHTPLNDSGLIFHTGLRHGVITTTGTAQQDIPVNRRFFMGGENTVRGYRRDQAAPRDAGGHQIGAVSYILWQVELEQRLTEDLSVVTFLDALGNAADISQYPFNETVASLGIGLNYRTFVGPLRLEYGYNIKKRTGDPNGTIQISLGFPF